MRAEAYRKRAGTVQTCKFDCEADLPPAGASGEALVEFHQKRVGKGGFDPCSILKN